MTTIVKNKKIIDFYNKNPNIHFEAVNLIFIDLFQKLLGDMNETMNATINSQILSTVSEIKNDVTQLNSSFSKMNNEIINAIYVKFQDNKRDYTNEITNLISSNFSLNNEKLSFLLSQNTSSLIDKTTLLINEIIPKTNEKTFTNIQNLISDYYKSISDDTNKLLSNINQREALDSFLTSFDNKTNNLLQPLFSFINASEERINKNVISLKNEGQQIVQDKIMNELSEFLGKYKNSSFKGQFGENKLESVLNQLFPTGEIINTSGQTASCDFRVNREKLPTILFETKNYDRNVTLDEVKKFIRDIDQQKCHGVFLSQHSGITSKQNYQIDIKGGNILVYVHNADYCPQFIKIACDIIDSLSPKLDEIETEEEEFSISKELLDEINKEYSKFVERKSSIISILKDFQKRISLELEEIKFPSLSKYLVSKYGSILNNENEKLICDICNKFEASSNKSLAAHKRGCRKKNHLHISKGNDENTIEITT